MNETLLQNASHIVLSKDGTRIGYLSVGEGPSVLVIPGVLSMAADYAAFARVVTTMPLTRSPYTNRACP
jgi:hypothetical protein